VLGRFLEHSRLYSFGLGPSAEMWIGSADLMHRNLDRRVEALVRIEAPEHIAQLSDLLDMGFDEGTASWHLHPDGEWERVAFGPDGHPLLDVQAYLIGVHQRRRATA
jgi:polyphosphate kinase